MHKEQRAAAESTPSCSGLIIWIQQGNHFKMPDDYTAKKHRTILTQINSLMCLSGPLSSSSHSAAQLQGELYHLFGNNSPSLCKNFCTPSPLGILVIKHCTLEKVLDVTSDGYLVHQLPLTMATHLNTTGIIQDAPLGPYPCTYEISKIVFLLPSVKHFFKYCLSLQIAKSNFLACISFGKGNLKVKRK